MVVGRSGRNFRNTILGRMNFDDTENNGGLSEVEKNLKQERLAVVIRQLVSRLLFQNKPFLRASDRLYGSKWQKMVYEHMREGEHSSRLVEDQLYTEQLWNDRVEGLVAKSISHRRNVLSARMRRKFFGKFVL